MDKNNKLYLEKEINSMETSGKSWAEEEIEVACKRERESAENSENKNDWDYGVMCYQSALKAYKSLMEDDHSGFSISLTQHILNRLIERKPLTPIMGTDDEWVKGLSDKPGSHVNKRMSGLFRELLPDGTYEYNDVDRFIVYSSDDNYKDGFYNGGIISIANKLFPITFPYMPADKPYKIYVSRDEREHIPYSIVKIEKVIDPEGKEIILNKCFVWSEYLMPITNDKYDYYEKINQREWLEPEGTPKTADLYEPVVEGPDLKGEYDHVNEKEIPTNDQSFAEKS